jgi:hypothetical protein
MPIGFIFWVIMLLILVFGFIRNNPTFAPYTWGWDVLLYILLFLLGWKVFGFAIHA